MLNIGDKVKCVRQFPDIGGTYDGEVGILKGVLNTKHQKYLVFFPETEHGGYYRYCEDIGEV